MQSICNKKISEYFLTSFSRCPRYVQDTPRVNCLKMSSLIDASLPMRNAALGNRASLQRSGIKRALNSATITAANQANEEKRAYTNLIQSSQLAQIWSTKSENNFINAKTNELYAEPTELTSDTILFKLRGGDKYILLNNTSFEFTVKLQKKTENGQWGDCEDDDLLTVHSGAVLNLLKENLEVRMAHHGELVEQHIINLKQDRNADKTIYEIQRKYDRLFLEKEIESDMHLIKELTYDYQFSNDSGNLYKEGSTEVNHPTCTHGLRPRNADIRFKQGSLQAKLKSFADELKQGKKYTIYAPFLSALFAMEVLPTYEGLNIQFSLGKSESHAYYIEDYTKLATANTEQPKFRFVLLKNGGHSVKCYYESCSMTTAAANKFEAQFANNKEVDVARMQVIHQAHMTVNQNATELQNFKFPNTTQTPHWMALTMKSRDDYNHTDHRANFYNNQFAYYVKKIQFKNATNANLTYREGVNYIDFSDSIDLRHMQDIQRRWMFGREHINMPAIAPFHGIMNGAPKELYDNEGESKSSYMKTNRGRHLTPNVLEIDTSHGKYNVDRKPALTNNTSISFDLYFRKPLEEQNVVILTSGYNGKYVMKKMSNNTWQISYSNIEIAASLL